MEGNQILSNAEIVDKLAKDRVVEEICKTITKGKDSDTLKDLCQDIYIQLLESDKTQGLYERKEINFWITRVLMNNICSSTSPYYRTYIYPLSKQDELQTDDEDNTPRDKGDRQQV